MQEATTDFFLKCVLMRLFPDGIKLIIPYSGSHEDKLSIRLDLSQNAAKLREKITHFRTFNENVPSLQRQYSEKEEGLSLLLTSPHRLPSMKQLSSQVTKKTDWPKFPGTAHWKDTYAIYQGFLETAMVFAIKRISPDEKLSKEQLDDTLIVIIKELQKNGILVNHLKYILSELAEWEGAPPAFHKDCQNISELTDEILTFLKLYNGLPEDSRKFIKDHIGGLFFIFFLEDLPRIRYSPYIQPVWSRYCIETRTFDIPATYLAKRPNPSKIDVEQVIRSYFPLGTKTPLLSVRVNGVPLSPLPRNSLMDDRSRGVLFFERLLGTLATYSGPSLHMSESEISSLANKLPSMKDEGTEKEERVLLLLRLGTFSAYGHADSYLREVILQKLAPGYQLKYLQPQENPTSEFFLQPTGEFSIIQTRTYAILGDNKHPKVTFSLQCKIISDPKTPGGIAYQVSLPNFCASETEDFDLKGAIYNEFCTMLLTPP